jgi:hypothetical protein
MDARTSLGQCISVKPARALPIKMTDAIKMTHAAGEATADDSPVLHAAIGLGEQVRAASVE